ncbi:MAG: hypothetical protein AAGE96_22870 [Cyanobacteria bacterium P01_G01_bin.19]
MAKKDYGAAFGKTIQAETEKVKSNKQVDEDRFAKAEGYLEPKSTPERQEPEQPKQQKKVIRDSFTLPTDDYELITTIRERCLDSRVTINKSEVIRAGLHALNQMNNEELVAVVESLTKIKTGRPGKAKG